MFLCCSLAFLPAELKGNVGPALGGYINCSQDHVHLVVTSRSYLRRHSALSRAISRQTGGNELERAATLFPSRVLPIYSCHVRFPVLRLRPRMYKPVASSVGQSVRRSTLHDHAAAYG